MGESKNKRKYEWESHRWDNGVSIRSHCSFSVLMKKEKVDGVRVEGMSCIFLELDTVFWHEKLCFLIPPNHPFTQSSSADCITKSAKGVKWLIINTCHYITKILMIQKSCYLRAGLDRWVRGWTGFLWLWGIQWSFSCPPLFPPATSVAFSLPFGVLGSSAARLPLLFKLNLKERTRHYNGCTWQWGLGWLPLA